MYKVCRNKLSEIIVHSGFYERSENGSQVIAGTSNSLTVIIIRKVAAQIMTDGSTIWCYKMHYRGEGKSYKVKDNIPSFCSGEHEI